MTFRVRAYQPRDRLSLERMLEALLDEIVAMDALGRVWRAPEYGSLAAERALQQVKEAGGRVLIAFQDEEPMGLAVGVLEPVPTELAIETRSILRGRVTELYVAPPARRPGIGARLVHRLERYFDRAGCDAIRIEVFAPNDLARRFYGALGYRERNLDLIRPLKEI